MKYKYLQEVQHSLKFGTVLPIDFSFTEDIIQLYPTDDIFSEIKDFFQTQEIPDYIWLKGIRDMNLFLGFKRLLKKINTTFPKQKTGVYVNCSLFQYSDVREVLSSCNLVVINLNTINPSNFYKSCICDKNDDIREILDGIRLFKKAFKGYFSIYTMFFKGINDSIDDLRGLKNFLLEVLPDNFSVSIFTGKGFESVSEDFKIKSKKILQPLPFELSFTY